MIYPHSTLSRYRDCTHRRRAVHSIYCRCFRQCLYRCLSSCTRHHHSRHSFRAHFRQLRLTQPCVMARIILPHRKYSLSAVLGAANRHFLAPLRPNRVQHTLRHRNSGVRSCHVQTGTPRWPYCGRNGRRWAERYCCIFGQRLRASLKTGGYSRLRPHLLRRWGWS
jgi:hypothetical protein